MFLEIIVLNFKNHSDSRLDFNPISIVLWVIPPGKTNLLDAIHYLSFTKSFLLNRIV